MPFFPLFFVYFPIILLFVNFSLFSIVHIPQGDMIFCHPVLSATIECTKSLAWRSHYKRTHSAHPGNSDRSVGMLLSSLSLFFSLALSFHGYPHSTQGDLVQLKEIPSSSASHELKTKAMDLLVMAHGLRHENINPLIGNLPHVWHHVFSFTGLRCLPLVMCLERRNVCEFTTVTTVA